MNLRRLSLLWVVAFGCDATQRADPDALPLETAPPVVMGRLPQTRLVEPEAPEPARPEAEPPPSATATASDALTPAVAMNALDRPPAGQDAPRGSAAASITSAGTPATETLRSGPATAAQRAMAKEIQDQVSCLRGRPFREDVAVEFQSMDDFRSFIQGELSREQKSPKGRREQRLLKAVGLINFDEDLIAMIERATLEQAAAYYDPRENTFYIVKAMPDIMLRATMAHELQHALQDQHSQALDAYTKGAFDTLDAGLAARFVVEGEASLVGNAWMLLTAAGLPMLGDVMPSPCTEGPTASTDRAMFWSSLRDMTIDIAGQTRAAVQNPGLLERLLTQALSPSVAESMRKLDTLPNFAYYTMVPPYTFGSFSMYKVLESKGWKWSGIDRLFERMPATTAEVLHPAKLIKGVRYPAPQLWKSAEHPFATKGWRVDPRDQVGELGLRIVLMNGGANERAAKRAAQSWGGDSVQVWTRRRGGAEFLAYDWNLRAEGPAQASALKTALWSAVERRRGELDLLGEVSPIDSASGLLVFAYTGHQNHRRFGRMTWSPSGVVLSEGWLEPPTGVRVLP